MSEIATEYALFAAQALTLVVAILLVVAGIAIAVGRGRQEREELVSVKALNRRYRDTELTLKGAVLDKKSMKAEQKRIKAEQKELEKRSDPRRRVFVVNFEGDVKASAVTELREVVTGILMVANKDDEVVVILESPGGLVQGYGLAASQLARFRDRGIPLTVAVDKVAASGGYMMACVANHILAAPFAVVGSIGVVAQLPNFSKVLKKNDIDLELVSAGEYKRTLTLFGENTDEGREKFREQIEETHDLFKEFVARYRPQVDIGKVATGEYWYGGQAMELNLVDELMTSDDYLLAAYSDADLYSVEFERNKGLTERLMSTGTRLLGR